MNATMENKAGKASRQTKVNVNRMTLPATGSKRNLVPHELAETAKGIIAHGEAKAKGKANGTTLGGREVKPGATIKEYPPKPGTEKPAAPATPTPTPTPKPAAPKIGTVVETPKASVKLFEEYNVIGDFKPETMAWLVQGKSGQMRVLDVLPIAKLLMAWPTIKMDGLAKPAEPAYILNLIPERVKGTDDEKLFREAFRQLNKTIGKSWGKLTQETKDKWLAQAKPIFNRCLRDYLKVTAPLKKAFQDERFAMERAQVQLTKKGIVHVAARATHRPSVEESTAAATK